MQRSVKLVDPRVAYPFKAKAAICLLDGERRKAAKRDCPELGIDPADVEVVVLEGRPPDALSGHLEPIVEVVSEGPGDWHSDWQSQSHRPARLVQLYDDVRPGLRIQGPASAGTDSELGLSPSIRPLEHRTRAARSSCHASSSVC